MKKRPNVLILMSDEHRFDISGFTGNKIVRTPFLDRLAEDAVVFENAYTPSPVCIPARQCIAIGQLPSTCKVDYYLYHRSWRDAWRTWYMGETEFFEGSVKVPLFIRYPKVYKNRVVRKNVNLIDLFATLCELTETEIPEGLDSKSLVLLLIGKEEEWIDETISQWGGKNLMIKWGSVKYQLYTEDASEGIFDLEVDASESQNLIDETKYKEIIPRFRRRAKELGFRIERN